MREVGHYAQKGVVHRHPYLLGVGERHTQKLMKRPGYVLARLSRIMRLGDIIIVEIRRHRDAEESAGHRRDKLCDSIKAQNRCREAKLWPSIV
jgi:hypothetical protein